MAVQTELEFYKQEVVGIIQVFCNVKHFHCRICPSDSQGCLGMVALIYIAHGF